MKKTRNKDSLPANSTGASTQFLVGDEHLGQRLDNFLISKLKGVPKSLIYRLVRQGKIKVNHKPANADTRIVAAAHITLPVSLRYNLPTATDTRLPPRKLQDLLVNSILLENAQFIVLNKPSGMAVHGGSGIHFGVIETMRSIKPAWQKLELAHRLDRDSSGCLLLAKKRRVIAAFQQAFNLKHATKYYLLLVPGHFPTTPQRVELPLRKNQLQSGERMVVVDHKNGKPAATDFHLVEQFRDCALVGATLQSGRTHQIRVHAASLGFPLAGDEKYGKQEFNATMRRLGLHRLFLHARTLTINWLDDDLEPFTVSAPLDQQLRKLLLTIRSAQHISHIQP